MYSTAQLLAAPASSSGDDRREDPRIKLGMFLNEYVQEEPYRAQALNVSPTGIYLQKLSDPLARRATQVGLEFELPGTNEVIWARAESRFEWVANDFHLTGLRFTAMARKHERLVRDFVREKDWLLERMWLRLRRANGTPPALPAAPRG